MNKAPSSGVEPEHLADDPPPFLGRWSRVYLAVLCYLAVLICALYLISRMFQPRSLS